MKNSSIFMLGNWLVEPELGRISKAGQQRDLQPQVMDLLVYLAAHHKEVVSNEELLSKLWEGRIVTSASIYSSLKQLRMALGDDVKNPAYIMTIPKRGYRLIADLEYIGSNEKSAPPSDKHSETVHVLKTISPRWVLTVLAVIVVAIGFGFFQLRDTTAQQPYGPVTPEKSIAVIPFTDMAPKQDHGWFSDGISEEILNKLAQLPGLKVAGRKSSFRFRNTDMDLRTVGKILGVSHLLEGSVRRHGDRVRVTAQLIRADDGFQVWSREYDRQLSDTIAIQDDISASIADKLLLSISADARSNPNVTAGIIYPRFSAYELYLQSLELIDQNTKVSLLAALDRLEKTLDLEPEYAEAHIAMARVYRALTNFRFYQEDPFRESDDLAWPHLEKALATAPDLAEAHVLLGDMSERAEEARQAYNHALSLNPNLYLAHMGLAVSVMDQLRSWRECVLHMENALEVEPLSVEAATLMTLFMRRVPHRWQEAEEMIANLEDLYPESNAVRRAKAEWLIFVRGQPSTAVPILQDMLVQDPDDGLARGWLVRAWYMLGETERALESRIGNPHWRFVLAPNREESLRHMTKTFAEVETWPREQTYAYRMLYAYIYVMLHEWQKAIDLLADDLRDLEQLSTTMPVYIQQLGLSESPAMSLAVAYRKLGDHENFEKYARFERHAVNIRTENGKLHNLEYSRAMSRLDAMEGKPHEALLELEYLVTQGHIDPRDLLHPAFDGLRDNPEFSRLQDLQLHRVNSEREKLGLLPLTGAGMGVMGSE